MASIVGNTAPIYSNSTYTNATDTTPKKSTNQTMGKDDFLKLLIAQLKNQDPLNPMKDTEFVAQLASFSSLEQMSNMSKSLDRSSAVGMIGKEVTDKENITGVVKDVGTDTGGNTTLTLSYKTTGKDGTVTDATKDITLDKVKAVNDVKSPLAINPDAMSLVGKKVTDTDKVTGLVTNVGMDSSGNTNLTLSYKTTKNGSLVDATKVITMDKIAAISN